MKKCQSALQCELLFIQNLKKASKSRKGRLSFTLLEIYRYLLGNKNWGESGGLLWEGFHALSLTSFPK